ncbi:MAG: maleylpyruvate isomerase family mycothiol-dependent enzyme [Propionibacteriaceae bacterium]|nr:maleylpyruvate isomerase family mycothiol-dependent enzyme [Propionibacteriaceae bacterium]
MVEVRDFREMGEALGDACAVLRNNAVTAGLDAPVPTCPGWTVRDLVAHQGLVHRWAAAYIARTGRPAPDPIVLAEADAAPDLLEWFDEGMVTLLNAIAGAPADLEIKFFLPDAPPPRDAWLRRQVHETTIHAADAMAARLGRAPRGEELWVAPGLAADGVDEVLTGFLVKRRPETDLPRSRTIAFTATDVPRSWWVNLTHDGAVTTRVAGEVPDADVTVTGTAGELYLSVWNRGQSASASDPDFWADWAEHVKVTWA